MKFFIPEETQIAQLVGENSLCTSIYLYSATDYKIPKLTFVFIEVLRQYDASYQYILYTKMFLNYH